VNLRARIAAATAAALVVAAASSCGGSDHTTSPGGDLPTSITITPVAETLSVGGTAQLTASAHDGQGVPITEAPAWTTSNAAVATVAASGFTATITGVGPGQAQIMATFGTATGTIDVTVLAGPVGNRDFAIASAQMTQGVQDSAGSIPMVLGGNPAVVNVFMRAAPASTTPMRVVLRLIDAGGTVVYSDTTSTSGTIASTPSGVTPTVQFLLPAARLAAGLRWQVVRDPAGLVPDDTAVDDVYPRDGPASLAVADVPPLTIRFVPITLGANGGTTASISPADFPDYLRTLKSVHPLGAVSAHVGASFTTSASFGTPPSGGDQAFWVALVSQLDLARIADPVDADANWFGVVLPPPGFNFTSIGGFSYIPTNGASTGPNTRTSTAVGPRWFSRPTQARDLVAHELGHSFGRLHAPCGGAGSPLDPAYPIPGGVLDATGYDVFARANGISSTAQAIPTSTGDVMGYCFPVWASSYTYKAVLAFRQPPIVAARAAGAPAERQRVVVVRGSITNGRTIAIEPAFTLDARPTAGDPSGPFRVSGMAADGRSLFTAGFEPAVLDHAPNVRHFTVAVPATPDIESSLASIVVTTPAGRLVRARPTAAAAARSTAVGATAVRRPSGGLTVACAGAGAGVVVLDANGVVRSVSSTASAVLASVPAGSLTVLCSDGVRTTRLTGVAPTTRTP
jgi:hypothetical protein